MSGEREFVRVNVLASDNDALLLTKASSKRALEEGKPDLSHVLSASISSPTRATKMHRAWRKAPDRAASFRRISPTKALAMIVAADLSVDGYNVARNVVHDCGYKILPSYRRVLQAKQLCYSAGANVTEIKAEVPVQQLLDHTTRRLAQVHTRQLVEESDNTCSETATTSHVRFSEVSLPVGASSSSDGDDPRGDRLAPSASGCLFSKWGFDGATGHSRYKQLLPAGTNSDEMLLSCTLVPLLLEISGQIVWRNDRPSSTQYCQPIRLRYVRETPDVCREEHRYVERQIEQLQSTAIRTNSGDEVLISHELLLTMVDGKVVCALTGTKSTQTCTACGCNPREMNSLNSTRQPLPDAYQFGISPLHARIRCFEFVLHLGYRMELQKRNVTKEHKPAVEERKRAMQRQFRDRLGLLVDYPLPGGQGNTNDGNTARCSFEHPEIFANITGVDQELIERLAKIVAAINTTTEAVDP